MIAPKYPHDVRAFTVLLYPRQVIKCSPVMNKPIRPKRIAFYASALTQDPPLIEEGILRYQEDRGGIEFRNFRYDSENVPEQFVHAPLPWSDWIPDGILSQLAADPGMADWLGRGGQPHVNIGCDLIGQKPSIYTSPDSIAALAVDYYWGLGFRHFALVGITSMTSRIRWEAFSHLLRAKGHEPLLYELETNPTSGLVQSEEKAAHETGLLHLLRTAPKPLAVLTPTVTTGRSVCTASRLLGLEIPNQIAVVATGNTSLARTCLPPLSAVHVAFEEIGYQAMALLDRMIADATRWAPNIMVPATRLVVRQSTQHGHGSGSHSQRLRQLIMKQACQGASIQTIIASLDVSRSTLERQYVAAFGCTPGQELLRVRLEKAKELILTTVPLKSVATALGYSAASSFSSFFRKQTGMTPQSYRRGARTMHPRNSTAGKSNNAPRRRK